MMKTMKMKISDMAKIMYLAHNFHCKSAINYKNPLCFNPLIPKVGQGTLMG